MIPGYLRSSGSEVLIPSLANAAAPLAGAGIWGAVAVVSAATPVDYILTDADVCWRIGPGGAAGTPGHACQLEIMTGLAGFEVPIAHGMIALAPFQILVGLQDTLLCQIGATLPFKPVYVPAGTRLTARAASTFAMANAHGVYVKGYTAWDYRRMIREGLDESTYAKGTVGFRSRVYPDAADTAVAKAVGIWAWSAWLGPFVVPAATTIVRGLAMRPAAMTAVGWHCQAEIGMGAAGAQVTIGRCGFGTPGTAVPGGVSYLSRPFLCGISTAANNTSLWVRMAGSTNAVQTGYFQLLVEEFR